MVVIAGTGGGCQSRCHESNHIFSDTGLHLKFQNISRAPIQSIWCTCSSLLDDGDGNAGVGSRGGVVAVSVYMGGTRGSCVWLVQMT